jgi:hypothetical protein
LGGKCLGLAVCLDDITLAMLHGRMLKRSVVLNKTAQTPKIVIMEVFPVFSRDGRSETMLLIELVKHLMMKSQD